LETSESKITGYFAKMSNLNPIDFPIGIGDDMAQMCFGGLDTALITTDMLLDGTHFDLSIHTLEQVGYKSMAESLSDCAAMATIPFAAVVAVALPKGFGSDQLKEIHKGLLKSGDMFGCKLIGGDITTWGDQRAKLAVNVTVLSKPAATPPIRRSTAKAGDIVCVTGTLGGSIQGKHISFIPRVKEALEIARIASPTAMMDISDGLSTDLTHLTRLSNVGAIIDEALIPISEAAANTRFPLMAALNDGEDFELLFTLSEENFHKLCDNWRMDTPVTSIGRITGKKVLIRYNDGSLKDLLPRGYDHLRNEL